MLYKSVHPMTLAESSTGKITPYPFASLPRCEASQAVLEAKLRRLYMAFVGNTDTLKRVEIHLGEIFKTAVAVVPSRPREMALEEIVTALPGRFIGALVRLDPYPKRGFVIFEANFAHALVHAVLTGKAEYKPSVAELSQPLTTLSEAVVEYAVLGILESLKGSACSGNVTPVFEDLFREPKRLLSLFSHHDRFAVFSLKVEAAGKSHLIRAVLPAVLVESGQTDSPGNAVSPNGIASFADFKLDFQLSIGNVTLDENELNTLHAGDIIILDECHAKYRPGESIHGTGILSARDCDNTGYKGYVLQLRQDESGIHGIVVGTA